MSSVLPRTARWRPAARAVLAVAGTALAFKLASELASRFAEPSGASYLFPPAAVTMVGAAVFGWWGVLGVVIGHLASPWGASGTPAGVAAFVLVHGATAAVSAVTLHRPLGGTVRRVRRVLAYGVGLAQVVSAILGVGTFAVLGRIPMDPVTVGTTAARWLVADIVATLVLGIPLLALLAPRLLLGDQAIRLLERWRRDRLALWSSLAMVFGTHALAATFAAAGLGFPHWLAVLLVAPTSLAAWAGGVGAAVLTNGLGVAGWIAIGLGTAGLESTALEPLYATSTILSVGALLGGLAVSANRILLDRVQRQQGELEHGFEAIVSSLSAAIEAKDPLTDGHLQRVASLAVEVGRELGLGARELRMLRFGALLHDIGKLGVPEAILNKPGPLDDAERALIEDHVEIGVRIIEPVTLLAEVVPLVRYHQERWDGRRSGVRYPGYHGLRGEQIPLGARILAVVDTFDAMTNDRPYRRAQSEAEALAELERESGRQFDPLVVAATLRIVGAPALAAAVS